VTKSLFGVLMFLAAAAAAAAADGPIPRYDHIFVIIEENHTFDEVIGNKAAPNLNRLAETYGLATEFFAEVHPSEGNYVAMVGGNSFGIHDDDAYWCKPGDKDPACPHAAVSDYPAHTRDAPNLAAELDAKGLSWKGYFEDIPAAGSPADRSAGRPGALYAAKHNGFMNFKSVQDDPRRAEKIVGFDRLERDIAGGTLPNFAHIVPNQCDDMHGLSGDGVESECEGGNQPGLVGRADRAIGGIVAKLMATPMWKAAGNAAIVITFDEGGHTNRTNHAEGCCGASTDDPTNFGGGWIPTVVITNHGPRGLKDPTPYSHYSLLRTTEAAFGLDSHAGHADDTAHGIVAMQPLFAVPSP